MINTASGHSSCPADRSYKPTFPTVHYPTARCPGTWPCRIQAAASRPKRLAYNGRTRCCTNRTRNCSPRLRIPMHSQHLAACHRPMSRKDSHHTDCCYVPKRIFLRTPAQPLQFRTTTKAPALVWRALDRRWLALHCAPLSSHSSPPVRHRPPSSHCCSSHCCSSHRFRLPTALLLRRHRYRTTDRLRNQETSREPTQRLQATR